MDRNGHQHAAEGGCKWKGRATWIAQLAQHELALDLESDDEEKDGHQAVVDPVVKRETQLEAGQAEPDRDLPERMEGLGHEGVRRNQGDGSARQQQHPAVGFDLSEAQERTHPATDHALREHPPGRIGGGRLALILAQRVSLPAQPVPAAPDPGKRRAPGR